MTDPVRTISKVVFTLILTFSFNFSAAAQSCVDTDGDGWGVKNNKNVG